MFRLVDMEKVGNAMKRGTLKSTLAAIIGAAFLVTGTTVVMADEVESSYARGGLLYDKWFKVVGAETPKATHPAYPSAGKKKGNTTWRCKECHGWDYKGKDGAYSGGSHFTGIKGIDGMAGADPAKIVAILKNETHAIAGKMEDDDFQDLAMFVSKGQIDTSRYIDAAKLPKGGDIDKGAAIFNTTCARCHREDGKRPKDMEKSLGAQMGNPWEVMHKIMNGHPGQNMPAFRVFGPQVAVDVMTYVRTLPKK